jgi:hypothetical protein
MGNQQQSSDYKITTTADEAEPGIWHASYEVEKAGQVVLRAKTKPERPCESREQALSFAQEQAQKAVDDLAASEQGQSQQ